MDLVGPIRCPLNLKKKKNYERVMKYVTDRF